MIYRPKPVLPDFQSAVINPPSSRRWLFSNAFLHIHIIRITDRWFGVTVCEFLGGDYFLEPQVVHMKVQPLCCGEDCGSFDRGGKPSAGTFQPLKQVFTVLFSRFDESARTQTVGTLSVIDTLQFSIMTDIRLDLS